MTATWQSPSKLAVIPSRTQESLDDPIPLGWGIAAGADAPSQCPTLVDAASEAWQPTSPCGSLYKGLPVVPDPSELSPFASLMTPAPRSLTPVPEGDGFSIAHAPFVCHPRSGQIE